MVNEIAHSVEEHVSTLLIGILISLFTSAIAWKRDFFSFPANHTNPANLTINKGHSPTIKIYELLIPFVIFIGVGTIIAPLIFVLAHFLVYGETKTTLDLDPQVKGWYNVVSIIASSFGIILYSFLMDARAKEAIWRVKNYQGIRQILKNFEFGVFSWLVCFPMIIVVDQLMSLFEKVFFQNSPVEQLAVKYLKMTMEYPNLFITTAILIVFVVPIIEEFLFRGLVQTWLKNYFGTKNSIIIASIIFALFHYSHEQGIANFQILFSLFALSCFLGFIYERQQSLWASIGLHCTFNAMSVLMILKVPS